MAQCYHKRKCPHFSDECAEIEWATDSGCGGCSTNTKSRAHSGQTEFDGCVHKGWTIEYRPKPGKPGVIDWDGSHPDVETMLNGKSINDLMDQIDAL